MCQRILTRPKIEMLTVGNPQIGVADLAAEKDAGRIADIATGSGLGL